MASLFQRGYKAFVRLDAKNQIIPMSLVFRKKQPAHGTWLQIDMGLCCNTTSTTTSTTSTTTTTTTTTAG